MNNKINRVSVLITNGENFVLIFRHKNNENYYAIPGGGIDSNETPENAAIREVDEELGFKLTDIKLVSENNSDTRHDYLFTAKTNTVDIVVTGYEKNIYMTQTIYLSLNG